MIKPMAVALHHVQAVLVNFIM